MVDKFTPINDGSQDNVTNSVDTSATDSNGIPPTTEGPLADNFNRAATATGTPAPLLSAVAATESSYNPRAISHDEHGNEVAHGLMQLTKPNIAKYGVTDPYDVDQSLNAGGTLLKSELDRYKGNVKLALAAYNTGDTNLDRAIKKAGYDPTQPEEVPFDAVSPHLAKQTQDYVPKVLANLKKKSSTTSEEQGSALPGINQSNIQLSDLNGYGTKKDFATNWLQVISTPQFATASFQTKMTALEDLYNAAKWSPDTNDFIKQMSDNLMASAKPEEVGDIHDLVQPYSGPTPFLDGVRDPQKTLNDWKTQTKQNMWINNINPAFLGTSLDSYLDLVSQKDLQEFNDRHRSVLSKTTDDIGNFVRDLAKGAVRGYTDPAAAVTRFGGALIDPASAKSAADAISKIPEFLGDSPPSIQGTIAQGLGQVGAFIAGGEGLKALGLASGAIRMAMGGMGTLQAMEAGYNESAQEGGTAHENLMSGLLSAPIGAIGALGTFSIVAGAPAVTQGLSLFNKVKVLAPYLTKIGLEQSAIMTGMQLGQSEAVSQVLGRNVVSWDKLEQAALVGGIAGAAAKGIESLLTRAPKTDPLEPSYKVVSVQDVTGQDQKALPPPGGGTLGAEPQPKLGFGLQKSLGYTAEKGPETASNIVIPTISPQEAAGVGKALEDFQRSEALQMAVSAVQAQAITPEVLQGMHLEITPDEKGGYTITKSSTYVPVEADTLEDLNTRIAELQKAISINPSPDFIQSLQAEKNSLDKQYKSFTKDYSGRIVDATKQRTELLNDVSRKQEVYDSQTDRTLRGVARLELNESKNALDTFDANNQDVYDAWQKFGEFQQKSEALRNQLKAAKSMVIPYANNNSFRDANLAKLLNKRALLIKAAKEQAKLKGENVSAKPLPSTETKQPFNYGSGFYVNDKTIIPFNGKWYILNSEGGIEGIGHNYAYNAVTQVINPESFRAWEESLRPTSTQFVLKNGVAEKSVANELAKEHDQINGGGHTENIPETPLEKVNDGRAEKEIEGTTEETIRPEAVKEQFKTEKVSRRPATKEASKEPPLRPNGLSNRELDEALQSETDPDRLAALQQEKNIRDTLYRMDMSPNDEPIPEENRGTDSIGAASIYDTKETSIGRRTRISPKLNKEITSAFGDEDLGLSRYFVRPNKEVISDASKSIFNRGVRQSTEDQLNRPDELATDTDISILGQLIKHYSDAATLAEKSGDLNSFGELSSLGVRLNDKLIRTLLNSGRVVQAAKILKNIFPSMRVAAMRNELSKAAIEKAAKEAGVTPEEIKNVEKSINDNQTKLDEAKKAPDSEKTVEKLEGDKEQLKKVQSIYNKAEKAAQRFFTPEEESKVMKIADALSKIPDNTTASVQANNELRRIQASVLEKVKGTPGFFNRMLDDLYTMYVANLISSPTSHFANMRGRIQQMVTIPMTYALTGKFGAASEFIKGVTGSIRDGASLGLEAMRSGEIRVSPARPFGNIRPDFVKNGPPVLRNLGYFLRALSAEDMSLNYILKEGQVRAMANEIGKEKGLSGDALTTFIDKEVHNSEADRLSAESQAKEAADTLEKAGIKLTPTQVKYTAIEIQEAMRAEPLYNESNRFAIAESFLGKPKGFIGDVVDHLNSLVKKSTLTIGGKDIQPLKYLLPFLNIAGNLANAYLDYTPVGLLRYATPTETQINVDGTKTVRTKSALQRSTELGRFMIGSTAAGIIAGIAQEFLHDKDPYFAIYGDGTALPPGIREQMRREGWIPNSLKAGNTYIPYAETPLLFWFGALGAIHDTVRWNKQYNPNSYSDLISNGFLGAAKSFSSQSFLRSVSTVIDTLSNPTQGTNLSNLIANTARGFVPASGALRMIAKAVDDPISTKGSLTAKFLSGIPVVERIGTKPALNDFGKPMGRSFTERTSILERIYSERETDNPNWKWLADTGYRMPSNTITDNALGTTRYKNIAALRTQAYGPQYAARLTPDERYELTEKAGPHIEDLVATYRERYGNSPFSDLVQKSLDKQISAIKQQWKTRLFLTLSHYQ